MRKSGSGKLRQQLARERRPEGCGAYRGVRNINQPCDMHRRETMRQTKWLGVGFFFSARGRRMEAEAGAPRASLYLKALTENTKGASLKGGLGADCREKKNIDPP